MVVVTCKKCRGGGDGGGDGGGGDGGGGGGTFDTFSCLMKHNSQQCFRMAWSIYKNHV